MKINKEKLQQYLKEEKIIGFESNEECLQYFNTYDFQNFKSISEMIAFQGKYGFNIGNRRYHINYDEALDVWEENLSEVFVVNNRQHYFLREIERLNYSRDEAYAEIINNKNRFKHYTELEKVIYYVFDERPKGRMWEWHRDKLMKR